MTDNVAAATCFTISVLLLITTILCLVYGIFLLTDPLVVTTPDMVEAAHVIGIVLVSVASVIIGFALIFNLWFWCKVLQVKYPKQFLAKVNETA